MSKRNLDAAFPEERGWGRRPDYTRPPVHERSATTSSSRDPRRAPGAPRDTRRQPEQYWGPPAEPWDDGRHLQDWEMRRLKKIQALQVGQGPAQPGDAPQRGDRYQRQPRHDDWRPDDEWQWSGGQWDAGPAPTRRGPPPEYHASAPWEPAHREPRRWDDQHLVTKETNVQHFALDSIVRQLLEHGTMKCKVAGPEAVSKLVKAMVVARNILRNTEKLDAPGDLVGEPQFEEWESGGEKKSNLLLTITRTAHKWRDPACAPLSMEPSVESADVRLIRSGQETPPKSVAGCVCGVLRDGKTCVLTAIGPAAVNQALKGIAVAHKFMRQEEKTIQFMPRACRAENDLNSTEFAIFVADAQEDKLEAEPDADDCWVNASTRIGPLAGCIAKRLCESSALRLRTRDDLAVGIAFRSMACARKILFDGVKGQEQHRCKHDLAVRPHFPPGGACTFDIYRIPYARGKDLCQDDRKKVIPVDRYGTSQDIGGAAQKCLAEGRPCLLQSGMLTLEKALGVAYQLRKQDGCAQLVFIPQFAADEEGSDGEIRRGGMELHLVSDLRDVV